VPRRRPARARSPPYRACAYRRAALARFVGLALPAERRSSSNCARSKPACASTSLVASVPLGVDTPQDLERARALLARNR
jgi:3-deoxy-manno-octulosonate cytidylyltransferase (CMP-KDO synthetase)